MTTSNDAKAPSSSPKSSSALTKDQKKASTPVKSFKVPRRLYAAATLAIALIALGSSYYAISTNQQFRQMANQHEQDLLSQINALKQQQIDTKAQLSSSTRIFNESQTKLQHQFYAVDKSLLAALNQRMYQSNDWLLFKARYYLELAQINAHWSDNLQTTTALLQQADTILANLHDQQLFNIRQVIAKEIADLQAMPKLDITGLLSQLDAALGTISNLPLKLTTTLVEKKQKPIENKQTDSTWHAGLTNSLHLLESLVVIRRNNENIAPLPSPVYESMLREEVRLNLQEAQWAILQNNDSIYQFSLSRAIKNIKRSFAIDAPGTSALLEKLQALQATHLVQQKPIIEQSLPLLNKIIDSKNMTISDKKSSDAGVNP